MRQIFSICKVLLFCFFAVYLFPSCTHSVGITITAGDTTTGKLTMVDDQGNPADTFHVDPGVTIEWKIDNPSSTVLEFTGMPLKDSLKEAGVLQQRPQKKNNNSTTWVATVKEANQLVGNNEEHYSIKWKGNDGNVHVYDPRIQVP